MYTRPKIRRWGLAFAAILAGLALIAWPLVHPAQGDQPSGNYPHMRRALERTAQVQARIEGRGAGIWPPSRGSSAGRRRGNPATRQLFEIDRLAKQETSTPAALTVLGIRPLAEFRAIDGLMMQAHPALEVRAVVEIM